MSISLLNITGSEQICISVMPSERKRQHICLSN